MSQSENASVIQANELYRQDYVHTGAECWELSLVYAWGPEYTGILELAYGFPFGSAISVLLPACGEDKCWAGEESCSGFDFC